MVKIGSAVVGCSSGLFLALATASAAGAEPVLPVPPPPAPAPAAEAVGTDVAPPAADGVPHLISPDNLPPGSTMDRSALGGDSPNVGYLKDLYYAVQNQEITGGEALLYGLAQRGLNTPAPRQAPGPNVPISGAPGAAPLTPLAPAAPPEPLAAPAPPAAPAPVFPFAAPPPPPPPAPAPAPALPPGLGPLKP